MPPKRAPVALKLTEVGGFHHNRRHQYIHVTLIGPTITTACGRLVDTVIPLDGVRRLQWQQVCPTCLDALPGFLEWWRREHQPIPY